MMGVYELTLINFEMDRVCEYNVTVQKTFPGVLYPARDYSDEAHTVQIIRLFCTTQEKPSVCHDRALLLEVDRPNVNCART
jgi:hypothetical protein